MPIIPISKLFSFSELHQPSHHKERLNHQITPLLLFSYPWQVLNKSQIDKDMFVKSNHRMFPPCFTQFNPSPRSAVKRPVITLPFTSHIHSCRPMIGNDRRWSVFLTHVPIVTTDDDIANTLVEEIPQMHVIFKVNKPLWLCFRVDLHLLTPRHGRLPNRDSK